MLPRNATRTKVVCYKHNSLPLRRYEPPSPSTWKRAPWVVAARQQKPFSIFGQVQKNKKHNYLVACLE